MIIQSDVDNPVDGAPAVARHVTALFGRGEAIARIGFRLGDTARGRGATVLLTGRLGMGKTALAHAAAADARARGFHVLRAACAEQERDFVHGVTEQLLDQAGWAANRRADGDLAALHALWRAVERLSQARPVLLVVDDLHFADSPSLRQLAFLANRLPGIPAVMVVTTGEGATGADRPEVRDVTQTVRDLLRLRPLDRSALGEMVRDRLAEEADDGFAAACAAVSGGIPLVLSAVLGDLAADGVRPVEGSAGLVAESRPWHLHAVFLARLRTQSERVRATAAAIGMLGVAGDSDLAARAAGITAIDAAAAVDSLVHQGVLTAHPLRFCHPSAREAAADLVPAEEREARHLAAAAALYRRGHDSSTVARHLMAITSSLPDWGADVLRDAGRASVRRRDPSDAARHLRRLLQDLPADSSARGFALADLVAVERSLDTTAMVRHALEAVDLLPDVRSRAVVLAHLPMQAFGAYPVQLGEALESVEDDLSRAASGQLDDPLANRIAARRLVMDEDARTGLLRPAARRSLAATAAGREVLAASVFHAALRGAASCAEVVSVAEDLVGPTAPEVDQPHTGLPYVATALVLAGRASAAAEWAGRARAGAHPSDPVWAAVVGAVEAAADLGSGAAARSRTRLEPGMAALGESWFDAVSTTGLVLAGIAARSAGDALADLVVRQCGIRTDHPALGALRQYLTGVKAAERGDTDEALSRVLDAGWRLERCGWVNPAVLPWRSTAAALRARLGDAAGALELARQEDDLAARWGAPAPRARALVALAGVLPAEQGAVLAGEALGVLADAEDEGERARTSLALAELLRRSSPREAARHLRAGRDLVRKLGMADGERPNAGLTRADRSDALTPAERRAARAAADGQTNRAIAEAEGVTVRAVEKHLTAVYRKLGINGRRQLRAVWRSPGE